MADLKAQERHSKPVQKEVSFVAHAPDARAVSVTGDFTGWSEEGIPLRKGANGDWQATLRLAPREYQYRLRVDGEWRDHAEAGKRISNPFGSENCVLEV